MTSGTQALGRSLVLLDRIVSDDGLTPVARLAMQIDLAPSSARRIIAMLERHGLVSRIAHGHYAGGPALMKLARAGNPHRRLIAAARAPLRALHRKAGWTAHLGIFDSDMVTYLIKEGRSDLFTREGAQLEAYCTGIGKALLAQLSQPKLEAYLSGPFVRLTPQTICDPQQLLEEVIRTASRGYAIDDREMSEAISCVAAPVPVDAGVLAAISLSGNSAHFPIRDAPKIARHLSTVADGIAKRIAAMEEREKSFASS